MKSYVLNYLKKEKGKEVKNMKKYFKKVRHYKTLENALLTNGWTRIYYPESHFTAFGFTWYNMPYFSRLQMTKKATIIYDSDKNDWILKVGK